MGSQRVRHEWATSLSLSYLQTHGMEAIPVAWPPSQIKTYVRQHSSEIPQSQGNYHTPTTLFCLVFGSSFCPRKQGLPASEGNLYLLPFQSCPVSTLRLLISITCSCLHSQGRVPHCLWGSVLPKSWMAFPWIKNSKLGKEYIKALYCHSAYLTSYIMWNAMLDEAQAGIKIARRNINNLR